MENRTPEIGTGATRVYPNDRYPFTVIEILSPKRIKVQADKYKPAPNYEYYQGQEYIYERDPEGLILTLSKRTDGNWREAGTTWGLFSIGERLAYRDPHI